MKGLKQCVVNYIFFLFRVVNYFFYVLFHCKFINCGSAILVMVLWSVMVPRSLCLRLSVCQQLRDNGSLSHNRRLAQQEGGGGDGEKISACEGQPQPAGDAEAGRRERVRQEDRLAGDGAQQAGGQRQTDQAL